MPKKKNGMPFETYPSPQKDEKGQKVLFARAARNRKITLDELEGFCANSYSIRNGEMTRALQAFMKGASQFMSNGYTIETPIGTFEPKLTMKRQVTNPDEVTHDDVQFDNIQFRASKAFKKTMKSAIGSDGYCYVHTPHSSRLLANEEHLLKALQKSIDANNGHTTVSSFARHSGLTDYSARKQLPRWCCGDKPLLKSERYGWTNIYTKV